MMLITADHTIKYSDWQLMVENRSRLPSPDSRHRVRMSQSHCHSHTLRVDCHTDSYVTAVTVTAVRMSSPWCVSVGEFKIQKFGSTNIVTSVYLFFRHNQFFFFLFF
jgi:hypothetical protein